MLCAYVFAMVHLTRLRRQRRSAYPLASACCGCPRRTKDLRNHPTSDYKLGRFFFQCQRFCRTCCSTIESVEAVRSTPRTGLNRVNCITANTCKLRTSPLIPPYKSGFQRAAWEPFGVSFSDIFLHAKKDVAAGGRRLITALRKNVITEKRKSPAAVPRAGLFPFSCSHHTTFSFHCLPLFFHFAEIFKKICLKTAPAPPKFRTAPT